MNDNDGALVCICGPTGSGKTDLSYILAEKLGSRVIVNADVGQLYAPLSIGTAMPNLSLHPEIQHHLFGLITYPLHYSAADYRKDVASVIDSCRTAVVVGGTLFYIENLFTTYPQYERVRTHAEVGYLIPTETHERYTLLASIDSNRAREIHPHDDYRIFRALEQYYTFDVKPSLLRPSFLPLAKKSFVVWIDSDDNTLFKERLKQRLSLMLQSGWIDEVKGLSDEWRQFLLYEKRLIGYPEIIEYLQGSSGDKDRLFESIFYNTWAYVKRQRTYWNRLRKILESHGISVHTLNIADDSFKDDTSRVALDIRSQLALY